MTTFIRRSFWPLEGALEMREVVGLNSLDCNIACFVFLDICDFASNALYQYRASVSL